MIIVPASIEKVIFTPIFATVEVSFTNMKEQPDTPVVKMDSVEGTKGGKVLLTIHFTNSQFMLAFILYENTFQPVIDIFEELSGDLNRMFFKNFSR